MEPKIFSGGKKRSGRGFSPIELKKADLDLRTAKNLNLRLDKRRKTAYEENIKFLKKRVEEEKKRREMEEKKKAKKGKGAKGKKKEGAV